MANPITWRNVNMPNFGSSNQLLVAGSDAITSGLDAIARAGQSVLDSRRRSEQEERDFRYNDLTNSFLNRINSFSDLNGYNNFSNQIRSELSGLGTNALDQSQVLEALNNRDNVLRTDLRETNAIADADYERDVRNQQDTAGKVVRDTLKQIRDPNNINRILPKALAEAGITNGRVVDGIMASATNMWESQRELSNRDKETVSRMQRATTQALDNFDRETEAMKSRFTVLPETASAFSDMNGSVAGALESIVDRSGKGSEWYELYDDWGTTQNPENAKEYASNALENVVNEFLAKKEKDANGNEVRPYQELLQGTEAEGFKAAALRHAIGNTPIDEDGKWDEDVFEQKLREAVVLGTQFRQQVREQEKFLNDRIRERKRIVDDSTRALDSVRLALRQARENSL